MIDCLSLGERHDFAFLRQVLVYENAEAAKASSAADRFYCRRCLVYVDRLPTKSPRDETAHEPLADVVAAAVAAERERSALIAENWSMACANAIRAVERSWAE